MSKMPSSGSGSKSISGFSKLSKRGKIKWIVENFFRDPETVMHELTSYWHKNEAQQKLLDGFSENTITNFPMPFSVAPNLMINGKIYVAPMVIEESSVVAAASAGAKFWMDRGGIRAKILGTEKLGQIHFLWNGEEEFLRSNLHQIKVKMLLDAKEIISNMDKRGGGVRDFKLITNQTIPHYYQLLVSFETCDSMGANFINSCLESFAQSLELFCSSNDVSLQSGYEVEILMSILSNYTPECLVRVELSCPISELGEFPEGMSAREFAERFYQAIQIAKFDTHRAVTHNKGIFNGIDAVVLATANDFRAVEACGHAYAARDGQYRSLSDCSLEGDQFLFFMEIPLALGTVGGLTALHPIAKRSLELLGNPTAQELMMIAASVGLVQNFSAIRSLVTTGIQQGHMKMHLTNILNQFQATEQQKSKAEEHFKTHKVSVQSVRQFLNSTQ